MAVALQDIPLDEPFLFEFDDDSSDNTYEGYKIYQRRGKALVFFVGCELGIGNRITSHQKDEWYCIATPLEPGYFSRLDCFSPGYWQFQGKTPKEIMAFGDQNPDSIQIHRMRIIHSASEEQNFRPGRA